MAKGFDRIQSRLAVEQESRRGREGEGGKENESEKAYTVYAWIDFADLESVAEGGEMPSGLARLGEGACEVRRLECWKGGRKWERRE